MRFTKQVITSFDDVQDNFEQLQTILSRLENFTIDNATTDRSYDADATTTAELADVVATLVGDLSAP